MLHNNPPHTRPFFHILSPFGASKRAFVVSSSVERLKLINGVKSPCYDFIFITNSSFLISIHRRASLCLFPPRWCQCVSGECPSTCSVSEPCESFVRPSARRVMGPSLGAARHHSAATHHYFACVLQSCVVVEKR
jgi:hypothetical protein